MVDPAGSAHDKHTTKRSDSRSYLLPPGRFVRRARGPYLYDQHGDRYLDLWLQDGAALLGHRPKGYAQLAKAEIDRGLWGAFPTPWHRRLKRSAARLQPYLCDDSLDHGDSLDCDDSRDRAVSLYLLNGCSWNAIRSLPRWLPTAGIVETTGNGSPPDTVGAGKRVDPGSDPGDRGTPSDRATPGALSESYGLPVPPRGERSVGLIVPAPGVRVSGVLEIDSLPSLTAALLTRGIDNLVTFLSGADADGGSDDVVDSPIPTGYTRRGVWLVPDRSIESRQWQTLVERALSHRVILPPDGETPIVFPPGMSEFDHQLWKRVCDEWPL